MKCLLSDGRRLLSESKLEWQDRRMTYQLGERSGPLRGIKVVEIAGIGPGPHACMTLADLGADVIRIERPSGGPSGGLSGGFGASARDVLNRGRPAIALDLKDPAAVEMVLDLVSRADILVEGLRPGVTERLGLGPEECAARNRALVYGRITGWGQTGSLAQTAGHDLTYLAISGTLHGLGQDPARPHFPGNLLGDFGGGSTYLVIGVLAALLEARSTGRGQVVDAAIVDGTAHLNAIAGTLTHAGLAGTDRTSGLLDGGAPFYDLYETADHRHVAVAALEPQFWALLLERLELTETMPDRSDPSTYAEIRRLLTDTFGKRTQADWTATFEGSDACVAPVLTPAEAREHPHLRERRTHTERDGIVEPAPAPRFSRTGTDYGATESVEAQDALAAWGLSPGQVV